MYKVLGFPGVVVMVSTTITPLNSARDEADVSVTLSGAMVRELGVEGDGNSGASQANIGAIYMSSAAFGAQKVLENPIGHPNMTAVEPSQEFQDRCEPEA